MSGYEDENMIHYNQNSLRNINTLIMLLHFKMQWHLQVMKDIVRRHKIIVLFILLLLAPTLSSLMYVVTIPVKHLVDLNPPYHYVIYSLLFYQALGLIWLAIHQSAFSTSWEKFMMSLPITVKQTNISEIMILFMDDFILWIPLLFATVSEILKYDMRLAIISTIIAKNILSVVIILLMQLAFIRHQFKIVGIVLLIDLAFVMQSQLTEIYSQMVIISLLISLSAWLIFKCNNLSRKPNINKNNIAYKDDIHVNYLMFMPFTKTQFKNVLKEHSQQKIIMMLFLIGSMIMAWISMQKIATNTNYIFVDSVFMLVNAFILSNVFSTLEFQRNNIKSYLNSLPISRLKIYKADLLLLFPFSLIANLVVVAIAMKNYAFSADTAKYAIALLSSLLFLAIIYVPQIKIKQNGGLMSLIIMCIFMRINYLILCH